MTTLDEPRSSQHPHAVEQAVLDCSAALSRSVILNALSLGFGPPTPEALECLAAEETASVLAGAASRIDEETGGGLALRVRALIDQMGGARASALSMVPASGPWTFEHVRGSYVCLFGHTARGGTCAYETEYGDDTLFQKPQEMSDIAGFLRAFGLVLDPRARERIDHVSCELEFMAFLAGKEAYAMATADAQMLAHTHTASRAFLMDHLGRFVPAFANRLMKEDPHGFYGLLAAISLDLVESECARFGVPLGPRMLRLRSATDDAVPVACSTGECPAFTAEAPSPAMFRAIDAGSGE